MNFAVKARLRVDRLRASAERLALSTAGLGTATGGGDAVASKPLPATSNLGRVPGWDAVGDAHGTGE